MRRQVRSARPPRLTHRSASCSGPSALHAGDLVVEREMTGGKLSRPQVFFVASPRARSERIELGLWRTEQALEASGDRCSREVREWLHARAQRAERAVATRIVQQKRKTSLSCFDQREVEQTEPVH